jgi:hypothetical protein
VHDITIIERRITNRSISKYARELLNTGLFSLLHTSGTSISLKLNETNYMIVLPRTIQVNKSDVFWQLNSGPSNKLYVRREDLKLTFLDDRGPKQVPVTLLDIFESISEEIVEKLAFHLDILPE